MNLILASASPRRQELLRIFGCPFTVRAADIDETMDPDKAPLTRWPVSAAKRPRPLLPGRTM